MHVRLILPLLAACTSIIAAAQQLPAPSPPPDGPNPERATEMVDALVKRLAKQTAHFSPVATIDHARLAKAAGVTMPPSIVTLFSNPSANTPLLQANIRSGLDLPHRILVCSEPGKNKPSVVFTSAEFIRIRHSIPETEAVQSFQETIRQAVTPIPAALLSPATVKALSPNYGIVEIQSDYSFPITLEKLRTVVKGQNDTVWFGEIDFQQDARKQGAQINPATLLLFGGPAPGGKAMAQFPRLGLDAFCQKILVYQDEQENTRVIFNDIVALANLHYGKSNQAQQLIQNRLTQTFTQAVKAKP
jgi:uncharacterized protein (DUF302 family)